MLKVLFMAAVTTLLIASCSKIKDKQADAPVLLNICLITKDLPGLVSFYGKILQIPAKVTGNDYAEFDTGVGVVSIFAYDSQEKYIPRSAESAANKSAILEFRVAHVDKEYARLGPFIKTWVKPPTTQPWGTRSIYFRDPDGNLINFFEVLKSK